MEILYENRYQGTEQLLHEYVYRFLCKKQFRTGILLILAVLLLSFLFLVTGHPFFALLFVPEFVSLLFVMIRTPRKLMRVIREKDQELHQGKQAETVIQFGEDICITEGGITQRTAYSEITGMHLLKHSCVLGSGKYQGIQLVPGRFTIGTFDDFQKFIQERCPNIAF